MKRCAASPLSQEKDEMAFECTCLKFRELQELRDLILRANPAIGAARAEDYARAYCAAELREDWPGMIRLAQEALFGEPDAA